MFIAPVVLVAGLFLEEHAMLPLRSPECTGACRSKMVGIASCLSLFRLVIPIVDAMAVSSSKQSSVKCRSHKTLYFDGPFQWSRVRWTCLVHCCLKPGSLGNLKKLTPSLLVLTHPAATQDFTILSGNVRGAKFHGLHAMRIVLLYTRSVRSPLSDVTCNPSQTGRIFVNVWNVLIISISARLYRSVFG